MPIRITGVSGRGHLVQSPRVGVHVVTGTPGEIAAVLQAIGDTGPAVEPTERAGILCVSMVLDPRTAIRAACALLHDSPGAFRYTLRWAPIDLWSGADVHRYGVPSCRCGRGSQRASDGA